MTDSSEIEGTDEMKDIMDEEEVLEKANDIIIENYIEQKYPENLNLPQPGGTENCWRYIDFTQYMSMLEKEKLHFSPPAQFSDPFEGSLPKRNIEERRKWAENFDFQERLQSELSEEDQNIIGDVSDVDGDSINKIIDSSYRNTNKVISECVVINCWHNKPRESAAMWRLYSGGDIGIAIKTTYNKLLSSIKKMDTEKPSIDGSKNIRKILAGNVRYIDYEKEKIPSSFIHPFFYKRDSFSNEDELRIAYFGIGEEFSEEGEYLEVEINDLIDEVVIAPDAPKWFYELVESVTRKFDFEIPVRKSNLEKEPWF